MAVYTSFTPAYQYDTGSVWPFTLTQRNGQTFDLTEFQANQITLHFHQMTVSAQSPGQDPIADWDGTGAITIVSAAQGSITYQPQALDVEHLGGFEVYPVLTTTSGTEHLDPFQFAIIEVL